MASIAVLAGGVSAEREISIKTGNKICDSLKRNGYNVKLIDAKDDFWLELIQFNPDAAFIALHGRFGEDGTIQGMLDVMNIEYVGSGVLASAMAMDKIASKRIFKALNMPIAEYVVLDSALCANTTNDIVSSIKFPVIVKPSCEGSAIGINIANCEGELQDCLEQALEYDSNVLVEEFVDGPEITVGILGNEPQKVFETVQIIYSNPFYDYDAKYTPGKSTHLIPADLPGDVSEKCRELALEAHNALNCRDFSRVDIKLSKDLHRMAVLEVNTIPGMTETSLYPEAAAAAGYNFDELIDFLIKLPLERQAKRSKISTLSI